MSQDDFLVAYPILILGSFAVVFMGIALYVEYGMIHTVATFATVGILVYRILKSHHLLG